MQFITRIIALLLIALFAISTAQAQRLKKPTEKVVESNMYSSANYKKLKKLVIGKQDDDAQALIQTMLRDYRSSDVYVIKLHFIAGNIAYGNKDFAAAYTHYETANLMIADASELKQLFRDASDMALKHMNDKEASMASLETVNKMRDAVPVKKVAEASEEDKGFAVIEDVPIYPGCEIYDTSEDRKKCMSTEITALVRANFNTAIATKASLYGRQQIAVQFKIDKSGKVVDILVISNQPNLEIETLRVMKLLPDMKPGRQRGKPVGVIYGLPIIFDTPN